MLEKARLRFLAEGDRLWAAGGRLQAEGVWFWGEAAKKAEQEE